MPFGEMLQPPQPGDGNGDPGANQPQHQVDGGDGLGATVFDRFNDQSRYDKAKRAYGNEQVQEAGAEVESMLSGRGGDSGGYEMDDDSLRRIAKRWYTIADKCRESRLRTRSFAEIEPPGNDAEASGMYASFTSDRGAQYRDMLTQQAEYCENEARKCGVALGVYQANEDDAVARFKKYLGMDEPSSGKSSDGTDGHGSIAGH